MIVKNLLVVNERLDTRLLDQERKLKFNKINDSYNFVLGNSSILVHYQKYKSVPYIDRPHQGNALINIHDFQMEKTEREKINMFLNKIFVKQRCIDLETLCIKYNEECWNINFDIRVLSRNCNLYELLVKGLVETIKDIGISVMFVPKCYYFIGIGDKIIRDPIMEEQKEMEWECCVVTASENEIVFIEKFGVDLSEDFIINNILDKIKN
ncbi:Exosome complex component Rrp42 [Astathelohania contejeani]|uniref:Ribosomal RNA-processing protein 42 n=1 Tax=Astathelohania contejeani TaxID=164912 RepID=A0ABQ7HXE1_9MICR|nr:Exosome complex component Rrp42 [Thelohania contejeani]